jgi:chemotaxis protein histidine kinase CheA
MNKNYKLLLKSQGVNMMCCKIYREDMNVINMFIEDCMKSLEELDKELLGLEIQSDDLEMLNRIFECIRRIKRGSSFWGLTVIMRLAYEMELIIDTIRGRRAAVDTKLHDSLLLCADFLNIYTKKLYTRLKEYDLSDENTALYLELSDNEMDDQMLGSLYSVHEKYAAESREDSRQQEQAFEENDREGRKNQSVPDGIQQEIHQEIHHIHLLPGVTEQSASPLTRQAAGNASDTKSKVSVAQSIRVNQDKIDKMMNMISELIIAKGSFAHISEKLSMEYKLPEISKEVKRVGAYVNRISDELQNAIMSMRMVEIKTIFQKMPRVIRDIAQSSGKKMELITEGENTEIDKSIIEQISDPLVHIIRNSADHGIEILEERLAKGKPDTGRIILRAYNKNKYVFIEIEDDGKGIDAEKVKNKALEKGIITELEAERMDHSQLINLIFVPGFSMAEQITEVSGRGVGMDIVKSNITKIKGNITIESDVDKGTKMIIRLPLSLAISHGLIVEVTGETYIIPLENIVETVKINWNNVHKFNDKYFTYLRGAVIGMEWLCKIFLSGERDTKKNEYHAVILSNGIENYAIVVDRLRNEQEFVVKTLEGHLSAIPGIAGSTLLGNGQVVLIVNPFDVLQLAGI